jgi:hypothetical protein
LPLVKASKMPPSELWLAAIALVIHEPLL